MKQYSNENSNAANNEDLACELKPLEGVRPKLDNADEEKLLHKLGYSYSNHSSPIKGNVHAHVVDIYVCAQTLIMCTIILWIQVVTLSGPIIVPARV